MNVELPPNRCWCVDGEVLRPSDHWPTCPKYEVPTLTADRVWDEAFAEGYAEGYADGARCCGEGDPATCLPPCSRSVARAQDDIA